ncbi:MAG: DUF3421 domain-containing protein, partial [Rhodospirillaceae bacterium]|nr:DUF3421 domain-containing protein [Rhodospirillaceae bacterium]
TITADSTKSVTLPLFKSLVLTSLDLTATRTGGKWDTTIKADSSLNNKKIDIAIRRPAGEPQTVNVTTKLTLADMIPGGASVPGLTDVEFDTIQVTKDTVDVTGKLKKLAVDIDLFKPGAGTKEHVAVAFPDTFTIATFIPQVSGTPLADAGFKDMSFIWTPKADAAKTVQMSVLPDDISSNISKSSKASSVSLKPGLTVFGNLEIKAGDKIGDMLKKIGVNASSLPLNGSLSTGVFAKGNLADTLLDALDISAPLPKLSVSGAPVKFKDGHFAIKGKHVDGKRSVDVSVKGEVDINIASKAIDFTFDIDINKTKGGSSDITITADSTKSVTLPLFKSLALTSMDLTATRTGGKWDTTIKADAKMKAKDIDVVIHRPSGGAQVVNITTTLTLADMIPGGESVPGLTDIEFDTIEVTKNTVDLTGKIKKLDVGVALFKPVTGAKEHVGVTFPNAFTIATFIPQVSGTALADASFEDMTFIWTPKSGATRSVKASALPGEVGTDAAKSASTVNLKPGLAVLGNIDVSKSTKISNLLKKLSISKDKLALNGGLSTGIFKKGNLADTLLDALDITAPLPAVSISGSPLSFKKSHFSIKGKHVDGKREVDVALKGDLDFKIASKDINFAFVVDATKESGAGTDVTITADSTSAIKVPFFEPLTLTSMDLTAARKGGKWTTTVDADSKLNNKDIDVTVHFDPKAGRSAVIKANLTLADLMPGGGHIPGLSDIGFTSANMNNKFASFTGSIKKLSTTITTFKRGPGSKRHIGVTFGDFDVASFIPGAEHTPLKDVTFDGATFIWAPKGSAENNVATNVFPKPLAAGLTRAGRTTQDLKAGLNLFAHLVAKPSGTMESLMKDVGVSAASFKLGGGLSSQVFKKGISGSAIKNAIMKSLDLKLPIPTPKIPGLSSIVAFKNGHLRIRGTRPDKTIGLDVGVSGDVDVHIKGHTLDFYVDVEDTKEAGVKDFTITGDTLTPWNKPFGIHWLDLKKLALTVDKKTGAGTDKFSIKVAAKVDVGSNSNMDITAVVKESNGKVTDAYFEMDGPLKLSDIPEINRIPNSSKFTLTKLIVSEHGIEADSTIGGRATDAFVFTGSGWNIALTQKDFALTELIHGLKETPLKYIKLPHAAVVLSETGISNKPFNQLNKVAQDAMKDIFGGTGGMVNIKKGLAVIASFDPAGAGSMKKAINGIGVHEKVVIMGEIGGIFGGSPMINLVGTLSSAGKPGNMPKFMKLSKNDQLDFFLSVLETEGDFDFELGLGVGFTAKVKDKTLEFLGKVKIQIMDEGFGIDIVGKMEGLWHKPFDIPGFSLGDVTIEAGTQEDGAIKLGFAGTTVIANDKFTMAADAELLPEALGAPQAIAFKATADEIPMFFLEQVALSVTGKVVKFEMPKGILPVFKKVSFAFATPGSADPDLGITGEGFGMAGQMDWLGHELGSMKVSIGPTSGLYANAAIDDLNLGPLHLKDNNFTMKAVPLKVPTLKLNSNIKFIGIKENVHVKFDAKGVTFKSDVKFGKDFGMKTDLELKGIDLSATHPSFKHADFFMSGDLKLDIGKFIAGPATKAINDALGELNKAFKKGEADVKKAQKKVDHLTNKINAERAKVRRERAHAEARVRSAENRVNSLTNSINYDWHRYHHCHGWKKDWCKAKWGIRARFEEGVRWGADKILDAVRELVAHFPIDLDPEVAFWIGLRDSAKGVLYVAEKAIEGLDDLDKVVEKIIDKLTGDLKNSVNINKASFSGDLKGIIEHDAPLDLAIDAEFFGLHLKDTFAFKVKDVPYDVEYLGLMGLIALDDLLVKGIVDMTKPLKNKIVGVVSKNIEKKMAAVKRELAKYAAKFNKYNATAAAIQARNAAFNKEYIKAQMAKNQSPIDYDPKSQTFKDEFMEIGHSGLCLTADSGTLMQYNCGRDDKKASQKWTTKPVKDKDVAKYGYVYLTQGSGCVAPEGKWKNVEKKFGEFSFPEPEFQGDGNIVVGGCDESKEYFWKILKHGDHWLYIANRATGQCLVFNDSNAVPGKAKANWAPCTGSANEVFRIADSVTPKYYHANMLLRSDSGGKCFGTPRDKDGYSPMVDCKHGARYDYLIDIRGDVRFVNRTTGKCLQPKGYKETDKVFEKTCTQLDFQWWSPIQVPGGWMIRNAQTNWCTESVYWGKSPDVQQGVCKNYGYNVITPVFAPETGVLWEPVSTAAFPSNRVKFDTAYTIKEREAKYTLKIHNEERAKLARLEANEKWAAAHKEKQCNPTANYWLRYWRARLHVGGWFADIIRLKARAEIDAILGSGWCKIKLDPWAKKNVQVDDYDIKVIQARLKKNVVPPPEPKWYACRAFDRAYEAWVPGVVDNRKCVFVEPWSGRVKSATKYDIVYDAVDVQWVRNTGGHLPTYAIPMGNTTRPKDNTLYSCRTMVDTKTFVGWTSLGKKCWYEKVGPKHSTNFEVLSRDSRTVYKLDLGD